MALFKWFTSGFNIGASLIVLSGYNNYFFSKSAGNNMILNVGSNGITIERHFTGSPDDMRQNV